MLWVVLAMVVLGSFTEIMVLHSQDIAWHCGTCCLLQVRIGHPHIAVGDPWALPTQLAYLLTIAFLGVAVGVWAKHWSIALVLSGAVALLGGAWLLRSENTLFLAQDVNGLTMYKVTSEFHIATRGIALVSAAALLVAALVTLRRIKIISIAAACLGLVLRATALP